MGVFESLPDDLLNWIEDSHQLIEQHGREHGWGVSSNLFQPLSEPDQFDELQLLQDDDDEEESDIELLSEDDEFFDPFDEDELDLNDLDAALDDDLDDLDDLFEDDEDF